MKVTKQQLAKIVTEILKEGWLGDIGDWMKDASSIFTTGAFASTLESEGSADALDLFQSLQGLGTDEKSARMIIQKRAAAGDIPELYMEYDRLLNYLNNKMAAKYLMPLLGVMRAGEWDGDLIEWLEDDGMIEEAQFVEDILTEAGIARKDFEFTMFGI